MLEELFIVDKSSYLTGNVTISGSKNASLPVLAATILAEGAYEIDNVPDLLDVQNILYLLNDLGCSSKRIGHKVVIESNYSENYVASYELVRKMRASILVLAPLLAKRRRAKVSLPGGCAIGERPIDQHIKALKMMGANIDIKHGYIVAECKRLKGTDVFLDVSTVTGTENIIMAAVLAKGKTVIQNAAQEPEVIDLCGFLKKMGANISGEGSKIIEIIGVDSLSPTNYNITYDRIEAGTFICIVGAASGEIIIKKTPINYMKIVLEKLAETGISIDIIDSETIRVKSEKRLRAVDITTQPYPGFPTDLQAPFMGLMIASEGISVITEDIFENRFMHIAEFKRMGANIILRNRSAIIRPSRKLTGTDVNATDLRAGAGLVVAALQAEGQSRIHNIAYIDRGYEYFERKLQNIGVNIKRIRKEIK
ncbi:MAG: UDP-N-acetylglucosamine 1-carboxyvinyltransferase [Deferribacterota bacterium]|nr:UDP-N-acetylglucosamine 1-carboxyvinyltransferase [Deferribacterota bacterium]